MSLQYAKIILDSRAPCGKRLVTVEARIWRGILSEVNTHRDKSRNSASSRAIPISKQISRCLSEPFVPDAFTANQKGMQGGATIAQNETAQKLWLEGRDFACKVARGLDDLGVHKQYANRVMEPYQYHTIIMSGTNWANMFAQRCHPDAQPEFQEVAWLIYEAMKASTPQLLGEGEWHLPYITEEDRVEALALRHCPMGPRMSLSTDEILIRVSVARCARVSYLTHDGKRSLEADLDMWEKLMSGGFNGHWSPFEHVARAMTEALRSGNFVGFQQLRKLYDQECVHIWQDIED